MFKQIKSNFMTIYCLNFDVIMTSQGQVRAIRVRGKVHMLSVTDRFSWLCSLLISEIVQNAGIKISRWLDDDMLKSFKQVSLELYVCTADNNLLIVPEI